MFQGQLVMLIFRKPQMKKIFVNTSEYKVFGWNWKLWKKLLKLTENVIDNDHVLLGMLQDRYKF